MPHRWMSVRLMDSSRFLRHIDALALIGVRISTSKQRKSDMNATTAPIDLAMSVCRLGADGHGRLIGTETRRLMRPPFERRFVNGARAAHRGVSRLGPTTGHADSMDGARR